MPQNRSIKQKLEYLGLDLKNIPKQITEFEPLEYRTPKFYDEKQFRQYRYLDIKDIQILLSPTTRLDEIQEKYKKASPLADYLDSENEENILKHTTFLKMLKELKIEDVEKVEEEQNKLNKKIPFKIKFEGNYLWQIYYSENTDKYFMIVPTEDSDYSTFFYLLKKQLEGKKTDKIFVPIKDVSYSTKYLKKSEFDDIENYLWLFTKDWPLIYEVYDKNENLSICIVGETEVYDKIKSLYKIKLKTKKEATEFYKLLKAMFILQTELPHYFEFRTDIGKTGNIVFYIEDRKIEYGNIAQWLNGEYEIGLQKIEVANELIGENTLKLKNLKVEVSAQEIEYLNKEKQISTFLECKKSFFRKFKYYFKYSKKANKNKIEQKRNENKLVEEEEILPKALQKTKRKQNKKSNYTIEEVVELYKELSDLETELKKLLMDINALKLKRKNMSKKIENATAFIQEIDNHKKSIFEFWKYSNKDEMAQLPEGEEEEIGIIKKITKVFDYEKDLEKFGKTMDKMQRKLLNKEELDSIYITTTNLIEILNKIKTNQVNPKDIETSLKELKKEAIKEKTLTDSDDFDIFGGISQDQRKVTKIKNSKHRELPKDKFSILEINKNTKQLGYKLALEKVIENVKTALTKPVVPEDVPIYKAVIDEKLSPKKINIFNINPEEEIKKAIQEDKNKIYFYKINLKEGTNAVSYTNIVFYDNLNKTLPIGQDLSSQILVDVSKMKLKLKEKRVFRIIHFEDEKDDFSKASLKNVALLEYDFKEENDK